MFLKLIISKNKISIKCLYCSLRVFIEVKALCMRNEDDINSAHNMKSICRAALLKDNAPDSGLYRTRVRVTEEQQFFLTTIPSL